MLHRLLVVELASVLAGPSVGQFLAEHGARVIKVENPRTGGDVTRSWHRRGENPGRSATYFAACNYGKESLALDLKDPDAPPALMSLLSKADVLISSFAPGSARRLGLSDSQLREKHPKLIHATVTGYGPDSARTGYDAVIQAESGFMSINGHPDGPPTKMPVALIDILAAHHLKQAILVALLNRTETGLGDHVTVSLMDAALTALANQATAWLGAGIAPSRRGSTHPNISPYGLVLSTSDEVRLVLAVGTDRQFQRLCDILDVPSLAQDEHYRDNAARVLHRDSLAELLGQRVALRPADVLLEELISAAIPVGQIRTVPEALSTEAAQRLILGSDSASPGLQQRVAVSSESTAVAPRLPMLGEHTAAILAEFCHFTDSQIDRLRKAGSIVVN